MNLSQQITSATTALQACAAVGSLALGALTFYWLYLRRRPKHNETVKHLTNLLDPHARLLEVDLSTRNSPHSVATAQQRAFGAAHLYLDWVYGELERLHWEQWEDERAHDRQLLARLRWPASLTGRRKFLWALYKVLSVGCMLLVLTVTGLLEWALLTGHKQSHTPGQLLAILVGILYLVIFSLLGHTANVAAARLTVPERPRWSLLDHT